MPLATYTDLKASIADWLNRDDLTGAIPTFISLAEAKINRELRIAAMESISSGDLAIGAALSLPSGYLQMRRIVVNNNPLDPLSPEQLRAKYESATRGEPRYYTIIGTNVHFGPIPDSTYAYELVIYSRFTALSGSDESNWLTTNAPDLLLYGALVEASPYVQEDARVPMWKAMFDSVMEDVKTEDRNARYSGATLTIRPS